MVYHDTHHTCCNVAWRFHEGDRFLFEHANKTAHGLESCFGSTCTTNNLEHLYIIRRRHKMQSNRAIRIFKSRSQIGDHECSRVRSQNSITAHIFFGLLQNFLPDLEAGAGFTRINGFKNNITVGQVSVFNSTFDTRHDEAFFAVGHTPAKNFRIEHTGNTFESAGYTFFIKIEANNIKTMLTDCFCNFLAHGAKSYYSNLVDGSMRFWTLGKTEIFQFSDYF